VKIGNHSATAGALLLAGFLLATPSSAFGKKIVYSPIVEEAEIELEYYLDVARDRDPAVDGTLNHEIELEYGATDRWKTSIYYVARNRPGKGFTSEKIKWANIYQLFEQGERWLDAGLYLEYHVSLQRGNPNALEFKLLLEKEFGRLVHTFNPILKREMGGSTKNSTLVEYAWRTRYRYIPQMEFGVEAFGTLGEIAHINSPSNQEHMAGPVVYGKLAGFLEYQIGYLIGLTGKTPDGTLKLQVSYEF
jgi:hypothetical protein